MNPVTLSKTHIVAAAQFYPGHALLQQHVDLLSREQNWKDLYALVAFKKSDLVRMFGINTIAVKEIYVTGKNKLAYIAFKESKDDESEVFGSLIWLDPNVVEQIMAMPSVSGSEVPMMSPMVRFTILQNTEAFSAGVFADEFDVLDQETFNALVVEYKFNGETYKWVKNDDPIVEEKVNFKLYMKDIPMTTRANRKLLRDTIRANGERLRGLWMKYNDGKETADQLSWADWMVKSQAVDTLALDQLIEIDLLPDDKYVSAMVAFKQGEIKAYWKPLHDGQTTELSLQDWCRLNFQVEYDDAGRKEAEAEIADEVANGALVEDLTATEVAVNVADDIPGVFVITFDGTIVENHAPSIGPASPFSLDIMKALKKNGHVLILLTDREDEHLTDAVQYLTANGVSMDGVVDFVPAAEFYNVSDFTNLSDALRPQAESIGVAIDYVIDHKHMGCSVIQISADTIADPTFYWGDVAQQLHERSYLTDDDMAAIAESLAEETATDN